MFDELIIIIKKKKKTKRKKKDKSKNTDFNQINLYTSELMELINIFMILKYAMKLD